MADPHACAPAARRRCRRRPRRNRRAAMRPAPRAIGPPRRRRSPFLDSHRHGAIPRSSRNNHIRPKAREISSRRQPAGSTHGVQTIPLPAESSFRPSNVNRTRKFPSAHSGDGTASISRRPSVQHAMSQQRIRMPLGMRQTSKCGEQRRAGNAASRFRSRTWWTCRSDPRCHRRAVRSRHTRHARRVGP